MTTSTLLQILLFLQIFVLGVIAAAAVQYWRRHKAAAAHETAGRRPVEAEEGLSPAVKQRLIDESELKIQNSLNHTVTKLDHDLESSAIQINQLVNRLASDIVAGEMERYRMQLGKLHEHASTEMGTIRTEIAKHEDELKARIAQELAIEKQRLIKQLDTKLADAVASFLNETLQHNVDLGNQTAYLISMLEEHKAEFIKEVGQDEVQSTA
jgi:hypothetical protein